MEEQTIQSIWKVLVAARKSRGYTQVSLAKELKKNPSTIVEWEGGKRNIPYKEFLDLALRLECLSEICDILVGEQSIKTRLTKLEKKVEKLVEKLEGKSK